MRTDTKIYRLRSELLTLLLQHDAAGMIPTSARFLFYELVAKAIIAKHAEGARRADQDMIDALTSLREDGSIPWDWIVDETRSISDYTGYYTIKDGLLALVNGIKLDRWFGVAPLILTESRSLAGVLRNLCREYGVRIAPTNGQCAGFLHNEIAPLLSEGDRVLYLGDWDKAGNDIEANTRRVLEREAGGLLDWKRVALTTEQVGFYQLQKITKYDGRTKTSHEAVETEALSQALIVQILRDELDEILPERLELVKEREQAEQDLLRTYLEGYQG